MLCQKRGYNHKGIVFFEQALQVARQAKDVGRQIAVLSLLAETMRRLIVGHESQA